MCGDINLNPIENIWKAMCSSGDMAVLFGYEIDFFSSQRFIRRVKSWLSIISTLCSWELRTKEVKGTTFSILVKDRDGWTTIIWKSSIEWLV